MSAHAASSLYHVPAEQERLGGRVLVIHTVLVCHGLQWPICLLPVWWRYMYTKAVVHDVTQVVGTVLDGPTNALLIVCVRMCCPAVCVAGAA